MLLTDTDGLVREWEYLAAKHERLAHSHGSAFDRAGLIRWMAWGASRSGRRWAAAGGFAYAAAVYAAKRRRYMTKLSVRDAWAAVRRRRVLDSGWGDLERTAVAPPAWLDLYR